MLLYLVECVSVVLMLLFAWTQIIEPLIGGRKLFPLFIPNVKALNKLELELNQERYEKEKWENM